MRQKAPAIAMFVCITLIVWARLLAVPLSPYGSNGAAYIEHGARVHAAVTVSRWLTRTDWPDGENLVSALDDSFPPLLHVMALPVTWLFGGRVGPVAAAGVLWLLLMGWAAARITTLVTGRASTGVLVAAGVFALPGLHGSAARYYFDLPMSSLLWASVAVLMSGWHHRARRAGVLGGLLGLAACLTKWTALPYLALMLAGAALTKQLSGRDDQPTLRVRARAEALLAYLGTLGVGIGAYLWAAGSDNSLIFTVRESALDNSHDEGGGGLVRAALGMIPTLLRGDPERRFRLVEHAEGLAFAVFSPILLLATVLLLAVWLVRSRRGWPFVLATAVGQLVFLVVWIRPVDERFLLAMAPALVLGAGIGLAALPGGVRRSVGAALFVVGVLVAFDFHHMPKTALSTLWTESDLWGPRHAPYPPPPRPRGLGASTSAQGRGWVRHDEEQDHRTALRRALLVRVADCEAELFAAMDGKPFITVDGSHDWFGFETVRRQLWDLSREAPSVYPLNWEPDPDYAPQPDNFEAPKVHACSPDDELPLATLVFADAPVGRAPVPPECPRSTRWRHLGTVADPDGGAGIALWSPFGVDPCLPRPRDEPAAPDDEPMAPGDE